MQDTVAIGEFGVVELLPPPQLAKVSTAVLHRHRMWILL
jgi:hypothetical protein